MALIDIIDNTGPVHLTYHYGHNSPEDQERFNVGPEYETIGILAGEYNQEGTTVISTIWLKGEQVEKFLAFAEKVKEARKKRPRPKG